MLRDYKEKISCKRKECQRQKYVHTSARSRDNNYANVRVFLGGSITLMSKRISKWVLISALHKLQELNV